MYLPESKYKIEYSTGKNFVDSDGNVYTGPVIITYNGNVYKGNDISKCSLSSPDLRRVLTDADLMTQETVAGRGIDTSARIMPRSEDYLHGEVTRYFRQDLSSKKIIEQTREMHNSSVETYGKDYFIHTVVTWKIDKSDIKGSIDQNKKTLAKLNEEMPSFSEQLPITPEQFV